MAMVLDAFVSYLGDLLRQVAEEELGMMLGISGDIEKMGVQLGNLKNFLADAERRRITDVSVQAWVAELKRAMYEAADILDLCQLKTMERGSSAPDPGCCNPLLFCLRNPRYAHEIGGRIKKLNLTLDSIKERSAAFKFLNLTSYDDRRTARLNAAYRKMDPLLEQSGLVGEKIEYDTRALVEMLSNKNAIDDIMLVAIVGVGGIGKTTLAKKVFNDEAIQGKFAKKIWLSITQEFNEVELLRIAITAIDGDLPKLGGGQGEEALLVPALARAIRDKKFFLVLDDMWGNSAWNNLLKAPFSHGAPGSRVLITTRHDTVAHGMKAVHPYHHVDKLGPEDAWSLLKKQVSVYKQVLTNEVDILKDIGLRIVEKCDGLPLAVKVMGGLLCHRKKRMRDWEEVLNDDIWSVSQISEEFNYAIYLSYKNLSPCLKQCFLHFSLKPKKMILTVSQFVGMWIGEGFVHGDSDRLEELGSKYHKELILRNLIEPDTSYYGQYVCHMHDVVRSFAQYVSRDEALVLQNGESDNSKLKLERFLRLSIETKGVESDEFGWRSLQEQKSLRSLILTGNFNIRPSDSLVIFSSLRTLHVESTNFAALVESLYQLKHLRYLSVESGDMKSLPENIHKMRFLQHISLDRCNNLVKLPDSIVKLQELRFLSLGYVNSMPRGFRALIKLRTIYGFRANMDGEWCSLEELGPLSHLRSIGLLSLENVSAASFAIKARLHEKVHLSFMSLGSSSRLGDDGLVKEGVFEKDQVITEEVFDELCPPPCIVVLRIKGYFGRQLPRWIMSTTMMPLNSLRILMMEDLACCTQLPDGLCQLPCLELLLVDRAPAIKLVGREFLQPHSQHLHPSSQAVAAFPRMHMLILNGMVEWEEWEWEEEEVQAMSALEELRIKSCKLRCIPPGLAFHARSLKKLTIWHVQRLQSVENFASVVELDLYDLPDLTRIFSFPQLQKLEIDRCRKLESLQEMDALQRLVLKVYDSETRLPMYLQTVKPSHLLLDCRPKVLASMALGKSGPNWDKFSHIQHIEAYADDGDSEKKWHLYYTSEPYSMEANIDLQDRSEYQD